MKMIIFLIFLSVMSLILLHCGSTPVYRGDGIHCTGGEWSSLSSFGGSPDNSTDNKMMDEIETWIGTPYLYAGESRNGVDCSAFTQAIYQSVNIDIPRTASLQSSASEPVYPPDLQFGDLIFFNTSGSGISHVGIYIGNGYFAHASSSRGVVKESLSKQYYAERIVSVGRFM